MGDPDNPIQRWNLLATSKHEKYAAQFNKLVILNPENQDNNTGKPLPIILAKKQNNQCVAYKPKNTNIIKQGTLDTRGLIKLSKVPGGVGCE